MTAASLTPVATFSSPRFAPLVAVTRNSLNPAWTVDAEGIEMRIMRRHRIPWREVERVTYRWRLAHQVTVWPWTGWRVFSANFAGEDGRRALAALAARGVLLDDQAQALLAGA